MPFDDGSGRRRGLVGGLIPAGEPCPFLGVCSRVVDACPAEGRLRPVPFSCGAARALAMCSDASLTAVRRPADRPV